MHDLLIIGDTTFPIPEGNFTLSLSDVTNEYESETGETTVEILRRNVATIQVSYNGLLEDRKNELLNALSTVVTATFYKRGEEVTAQMRVSGISESKVFFKANNDVAVWSLTFKLEEL